MSHNHASHDHHHNISDMKGKSLMAVILLNTIITIAEIVGGVIAGSLSLLSDALHNFSDVIAIIISYFAIQISKKRSNIKKTFGYKRAEILAATINSSVLIVISIYLFKEAYLKLISPQPINASIVIWVALVGLFGNAISVLYLKKDSDDNMNIKSAYLHLMSDAFSSVAVILGGIAIYYFKCYWIDPVLTILIGLYILKSSYEILKKAVNILMQGVPEGFDVDKIISDLKQIDMVQDIHHVHFWSMSESDIHFEAHANIKNIMISETSDILKRFEVVLKEQHSINHFTIQFECNHCKEKSIICDNC